MLMGTYPGTYTFIYGYVIDNNQEFYRNQQKIKIYFFPNKLYHTKIIDNLYKSFFFRTFAPKIIVIVWMLHFWPCFKFVLTHHIRFLRATFRCLNSSPSIKTDLSTRRVSAGYGPVEEQQEVILDRLRAKLTVSWYPRTLCSFFGEINV